MRDASGPAQRTLGRQYAHRAAGRAGWSHSIGAEAFARRARSRGRVGSRSVLAARRLAASGRNAGAIRAAARRWRRRRSGTGVGRQSGQMTGDGRAERWVPEEAAQDLRWQEARRTGQRVLGDEKKGKPKAPPRETTMLRWKARERGGERRGGGEVTGGRPRTGGARVARTRAALRARESKSEGEATGARSGRRGASVQGLDAIGESVREMVGWK